MARSTIPGVIFVCSAVLGSSFVPGCNSDEGTPFASVGGSPNTAGSNSSGNAPSSANGGSSATNNVTGSGGVVAGTVDPDAGTFEPVTTVDSPATPYVTTCDSCPASEPLHVQCSSGCCCAHYCEGQFGSIGDKPCCDAQGGVIGLNCTAK